MEVRFFPEKLTTFCMVNKHVLNTRYFWGIRILSAILIFFVIISLSILASSVLKPAYYSVLASCYGEDALNNTGYSVRGSFAVEYNITRAANGKDETICASPIIYAKDFADLEALKHEECHYRQYLRRALNTCNNKIGLYFDEVECYVKQQF